MVRGCAGVGFRLPAVGMYVHVPDWVRFDWRGDVGDGAVR